MPTNNQVLVTPEGDTHLTITEDGLTLECSGVKRQRWHPFLPGFLRSRGLLDPGVKLTLRRHKLDPSLGRLLHRSNLLLIGHGGKDIVAVVGDPLGPGHCLAILQAMPHLVAISHERGVTSAPPPGSQRPLQLHKPRSLPPFFTLRPCRPLFTDAEAKDAGEED